MNFLDGKTIITVSALIGAAALIKASQLPFTSKTAQTAMATAPSAAVITAVSAPLAVYLLVRFYPFFEAAPAVSAAIVWIGALSALTAAFCAWGSSDIMRALAYAMISELGLAVSCAGTNGAYPAAFHAFCLAFYGSLLIFAGGVIISGKKRRSLNEMGGLRYAMPVTYLVFIAAGASLAGIPPFTGFYSKGLMLSAFWQSPSGVLPVIILTYIMGGLYTGRIFLKAFHGERGQYTQNLTVDEGSSSTKGVMIFLAAACAVIGWTLTHNRIFSSITALADNTGSFSVEGKAIAFSCGAAGFALALLVFFEKPAGLWKYLKKLSWPAKAAENDFGFEFLIRRAGKAGGMAVTAFDHTERAIDGSLSFILSKLPKGGTPDTNTATKAILTASFIISLFVLFVALG
jgi:NADH-quinone oxidoreductase subunit L